MEVVECARRKYYVRTDNRFTGPNNCFTRFCVARSAVSFSAGRPTHLLHLADRSLRLVLCEYVVDNPDRFVEVPDSISMLDASTQLFNAIASEPKLLLAQYKVDCPNPLYLAPDVVMKLTALKDEGVSLIHHQLQELLQIAKDEGVPAEIQIENAFLSKLLLLLLEIVSFPVQET